MQLAPSGGSYPDARLQLFDVLLTHHGSGSPQQSETQGGSSRAQMARHLASKAAGLALAYMLVGACLNTTILFDQLHRNACNVSAVNIW